MDLNKIKELKESINSKLETESGYLTNRELVFDKLKKSFQALASKDVQLLINKIKYRIGSLINAHNFSSLANQEEVEKDNAELNQLVSELNNEILNIEDIRKGMDTSYEEPKYQDFAQEIERFIGRTLEASNDAVRKATDVLSHKFDSVESSEDKVEETIEESIENDFLDDDIPVTEMQPDSIAELEESLSKDLQPIQEDKKDLELVKSDLENADLVVQSEPAPEEMVAPLRPIDQPDLNSLLGVEPKEEVVENKTEEKNIQFPTNEIKSAANVDEGPVLVTNVETFDLNENKDNEGPVLTRAA